MRRPPPAVVRMLDGIGIAVRRFVVGHTPFARPYERLAGAFWTWWDRASRGAAGPVLDRYGSWLEVNRWTARDRRDLERRLAAAGTLPRLSVVMPVHDPPLPFLEQAIDSALTQVHGDFELCVADDASLDGAVRACLAQRATADRRIKVVRLAENVGIGGATNAAAALATGEFLVFLDHDDVLHPAALGEVALALAERREADLLYTDHDKIDEAGRRYEPQLKPAWSPELLLSYMYLGHLRVVRRRVFESLGGCRAGFDGAQDHDLALRVAEAAPDVVHLPLVLYHWRAWSGSVASSGRVKPAAFEAGRRAVSEAFARRSVEAEVTRPPWAEQAALALYEARFSDDGPEVAVLIPTRNRADLLRPCLRSLARTTYRRYRVVVIDNGSDDPETLQMLDGLPHVLRLPDLAPRWSFASVMNRAAAQVDAEWLLLLNDDTEVVAPEWLSAMVGYARLPGVGAVGAKLVRPDGRIDHAGVVHGADAGLPGHAFRGRDAADSGYMSLAAVARNCSAVTAACLLTPRALFRSVGGLDEARFAVAYNDVDYCDRIRAAGHRVVYCPAALLRHHVGASRSPREDPRERLEMRRSRPRPHDDYVSPYLTLEGGGLEIVPRRLPRRPRTPLRVLLWGTDLGRTGGPLHQLELAAGLRDRCAADVRVTVVNDGPLGEEFARKGLAVEVRAHPLVSARGRGYDAAVDILAGEMAAARADVVVANTLEAFYAIDAAARVGIASVWNVHEARGGGGAYGGWPPGLGTRAEACFRHPYRIVFVSQAARDSYAWLDVAHRATVIRNVLHPARLRAASPLDRAAARAAQGAVRDDVVFLLLGTVCERKGQLDLAGALRRLPPALAARARFAIVGDRGLPYGRELRRRVAALPAFVRERVRVHDEVADPTPFYHAADVFVCTSRVESYPRVILEAMGHGLPVVTTPAFGITEQVAEGVNAIFYRAADVSALARAIERLIADPVERGRFAQASPATLAALGTFESMIDAYAEVLNEAAETGARTE